MNLFLTIAIIITNIVAVVLVYQILKKQPKKEILIFIAIGIAIIYGIISIIYWLSGIGIDESVHNATKNFVVYLFVPVNVILFMPYIAIQYKKIRLSKKVEKYDLEKLSTKVTILIMIFIAISIGEYFYFRNIQNNIKNIGTENNKNNVIENSVIVNENITNNIIENTVSNSIDNTINSTINNTIITNENTSNVTNKINEV